MSNLTFVGTPNSTDVPLLKKAFSQYRSSALLPGSKTKLVVNATLNVLHWQNKDIMGRVMMDNPTGVPITVIDSKLSIFSCSNELKNRTCLEYDYSSPVGLYSPESFSDAPVVIPPHSVSLTPAKPFALEGTESSRILEQMLLDGAATTAIRGNFTMKQGELEINVDYAQVGIETFATM